MWAGCEVHYAGISKRPVRINNSPFLGATIYGCFEESIHKYGVGCNDSKFKSFILKNKGLGIWRHKASLFIGVRLFGLQTLILLKNGFGKEACLTYHHYDGEAVISGKFDWRDDLSNQERFFLYQEWCKKNLVGDIVEMSPLKPGDLDPLEKETLRKIFRRVMAKGNESFSRMYNPEKAEKDQPILDYIEECLK